MIGNLTLARPALAKAAQSLIWADTFDWLGLDQWQEVFNGQLHDPTLPCRTKTSEHVSWEAINGTAQLTIDGSVPCRVVLQPRGLPDLPSQWQVEFTFEPYYSLADYNWLVLWQDQHNYLGFHLFDSTLYAEKVVQGQGYALQPETIPFHFSAGERYQVSLQYEPDLGRITLLINGEEKAQFWERVGDPQVVGGWPGLAGSVGAARNFSRVAYDNWRLWALELTEPEAVTLPVLLLQQTDPRWSQLLYDQADTWSPEDPSVARWGCALTSAAMVFRFFGLTTLPDGQALTPATLNTWLQQQADGYVGQGWLNWRALSRLSGQIEQLGEAPALEFRYQEIPTDFVPWFRSLFWQGWPLIVAAPDHFVVAHGYSALTEDILIRDPAFARTTLRPYLNQPLSGRLFIPTHTDFSAITLLAEPGVILEEPTGTVLPVVETWPYPVWVYDWFQPTAGEYTWYLRNSSQESRLVTILTYDQTGHVRQTATTLPPHTQHQALNLQFDPQGETYQLQLPGLVSSSLERRELKRWLLRDDMFSPWLIDRHLDWQQQLAAASSLVAAQTLTQTWIDQLQLDLAHGWLSAAAVEKLQTDLQQLLQQQWP